MMVRFDGAVRRARAEQRLAGWTAYQTAALSRAAKLPKFADFMGDKPEKRRDPMSALRSIAARLPKIRGAP